MYVITCDFPLSHRNLFCLQSPKMDRNLFCPSLGLQEWPALMDESRGKLVGTGEHGEMEKDFLVPKTCLLITSWGSTTLMVWASSIHLIVVCELSPSQKINAFNKDITALVQAQETISEGESRLFTNLRSEFLKWNLYIEKHFENSEYPFGLV